MPHARHEVPMPNAREVALRAERHADRPAERHVARRRPALPARPGRVHLELPRAVQVQPQIALHVRPRMLRARNAGCQRSHASRNLQSVHPDLSAQQDPDGKSEDAPRTSASHHAPRAEPRPAAGDGMNRMNRIGRAASGSRHSRNTSCLMHRGVALRRTESQGDQNDLCLQCVYTKD